MSKTPKPIIHSRDHEHGGADPVRILWESDGTGAGSGFTPLQGTYSNSGSASIANGSAAYLGWAYYDGEALLDLTAATTPTVIDAGLYLVTASVICSTIMTAGGGFTIGLEMSGGQTASVAALGTASPTGFVSGIYPQGAGSHIRIAVSNYDGSTTRTFLISEVSVARLA